MNNKYQFAFNNVCFFLVFTFLLYQQAFIRNTAGFINELLSYSDEVIVLLLLLVTVVKKRNKYKKDFLVYFSILFVFITLLSNYLSGYQEMIPVFVDAFVCCKFIIVFYCIQCLIQNKKTVYNLLNIIYYVSKYSIVLFFALSIINIVFPIFPTSDYRYFMNGIKLFFGHPTFFAAASITCVCGVMAGDAIKKRKNNDICVYMGLACAIFTVRSKAIAGAVVILLLYLYFVKFRFTNIYVVLVAGLVSTACLGYDQITFYYGGRSLVDDNFVRERLLYDSFKIANQYFPFGSGFGTFASDMANKHFTPLYFRYGYKTAKFMSDSFWPIVIAQSGYVGLVIFFAILICILCQVAKLLNYNIELFCASLGIIAYLAICTLGETSFFHPYSCAMFVLVGLCVTCFRCDNKKVRNIF